MKITLENFRADNIPTQKQVEDLGQFLIENFGSEIGGNKEANGEGAIEMAVRLLLELKEIRLKIRNINQLATASVWHLNNPQGTKMNIPNAVYEVWGKKLAQIPKDREMSESEALEIVRKK